MCATGGVCDRRQAGKPRLEGASDGGCRTASKHEQEGGSPGRPAESRRHQPGLTDMPGTARPAHHRELLVVSLWISSGQLTQCAVSFPAEFHRRTNGSELPFFIVYYSNVVLAHFRLPREVRCQNDPGCGAVAVLCRLRERESSENVIPSAFGPNGSPRDARGRGRSHVCRKWPVPSRTAAPARARPACVSVEWGARGTHTLWGGCGGLVLVQVNGVWFLPYITMLCFYLRPFVLGFENLF